MKKLVLLITVLLVTSGCVTQSLTYCEADSFVLQADYPGAKLGECNQIASDHLLVLNEPESKPINHSPWYGFQIVGEGEATISIRYDIHKHRYPPKISRDGSSWTVLTDEAVSVTEEGAEFTIKLRLDGEPVWISAQENITYDWYDRWLDELGQENAVERRLLGRSTGGKSIDLVETNPQAPEYVLLLGRQHPPEVTGAIGMRHFVEQLLDAQKACGEDDSSECQWLRNVNFVAIPLLNPDGVDAGYWRHTLGHLDLNRDWGPFSQTESRLVKNLVDEMEAAGKRMVLMLDFHSTSKNVFYTQADEETTNPAMFAARWLKQARSLGTYEFTREPRHNTDRPTAKNYFFTRYGIPSITYEVGDNTDRNEIAKSARVFARAMITTLAGGELCCEPQ